MGVLRSRPEPGRTGAHLKCSAGPAQPAGYGSPGSGAHSAAPGHVLCARGACRARAQSSPGGGCAPAQCGLPTPTRSLGLQPPGGGSGQRPVGSDWGGPGQTGPTGAPRPLSGRRLGQLDACLLAVGPATLYGKNYGASGRPQRHCPLECRPSQLPEVRGRARGVWGLGTGYLSPNPFPDNDLQPPGIAVRYGEVGGIWVFSKA